MSFSGRLRSCLLLVALLGVAATSTQHAHAQTSAADNARATDLFKRGKQAFGRGDMAEAEQLFAEAWAIRKSSDIAANLGQSQLEQQKFRVAAEHFAWALANLLPSATDTQRKAVETGLARARAEVGMLRLNVKPEGASVLVGEQALGTDPTPHGVFVEPGEVIVSVKHPGFVSVDKRLMVAKGTEQAVDIQLLPGETPQPPTTGPIESGLGAGASGPATDVAEEPQKSLVPAYVATGVAVVGGVAGVVFTLSAGSKEDDADQHRDELQARGGCAASSSPECTELKSERESVDTSRNLAVGAFIVGGVAAVTAGYFYWDALSGRRPRDAGGVARAKLLPKLEVSRSRAGSAGPALDSFKLSFAGSF
jgi:hypothetical protein